MVLEQQELKPHQRSRKESLTDVNRRKEFLNIYKVHDTCYQVITRLFTFASLVVGTRSIYLNWDNARGYIHGSKEREDRGCDEERTQLITIKVNKSTVTAGLLGAMILPFIYGF